MAPHDRNRDFPGRQIYFMGGNDHEEDPVPGSSLCTDDCLGAPALAEETYTIAINLKTLSSEYWQNVKSGCDAAVTDGIEIEVQGAAAETEIAEQVAQLETQLAANPDAIIIAPPDGDAVIGVLESSGYEGVVVFCDNRLRL